MTDAPVEAELFPALLVTTAVKPPPALEERARRVAAELNAPYAPRRNVTAARLFQETGAARLLVIGPERIALRDRAEGIEYAYHPNMVLVRAHNLRRGARDLFAEATGLSPGDSFLDCTLGFASEATLAALLVGEAGRVVGLESVPELAAVTRAGLSTFPLRDKALRAAMRRVGVVTANYREFLRRSPSGAFDVVYFDPFFEARLPGSEHALDPLVVFGDPSPLDAASIREARRAARRRVVVKHPKHASDAGGSVGWAPDDVAEVVTARKSRVAYTVLNAFAPPRPSQ